MQRRAVAWIVANEGGERPSPVGRLRHNIRMNVAKTNKEPTMTQRIPENYSATEWRPVTIMGNTMPPRVPNDDDDDDEDEDEDNDNDTDEDQPPVVREPEEDE